MYAMIAKSWIVSSDCSLSLARKTAVRTDYACFDGEKTSAKLSAFFGIEIS